MISARNPGRPRLGDLKEKAVSVRMPPENYETIKAAARKKGISLAFFVRAVLMAEAKKLLSSDGTDNPPCTS